MKLYNGKLEKNYLPLNEEKGDLDIPENDMDINGIGVM